MKIFHHLTPPFIFLLSNIRFKNSDGLRITSFSRKQLNKQRTFFWIRNLTVLFTIPSCLAVFLHHLFQSDQSMACKKARSLLSNFFQHSKKIWRHSSISTSLSGVRSQEG